jgi:asparagine synthase (glutamine-hydrolysing)
MCGIVGYTGIADATHLEQMNAAQRHRGPDDAGTYSCERDQVHFAMRRLSIIDLTGGKQPMRNRRGTLCIVFNGEIFNAPELRRSLEKVHYPFQTDHSDTEVLLALYEQEGRDMVQRLNGMFAFVIHDREKHLLFGTRDPFGIKPLHWSLQGGKFAFASEIKSLLKLPWIDTTIDAQALYDFFTCQAIPAPSTIYAGIRKLPAGTAFTYDLLRQDLRIQAYFEPFSQERKGALPLPKDQRELPAFIREHFLRVVRRWSLSDVPIACALSGGIDSPSVVGALAQHAAQPIHTYTLGFCDAPDLDERDLARSVAEWWGTEHHEMIITEDDLLTAWPKMLEALDEPYAGGLPSWFVFQQMAQDVKVALTGTGGDELFSNYHKWKPYESLEVRLRRIRRYLQQGGTFRDLLRSPHGTLHYPATFTDGQKRSTLLRDEWMEGVRNTASLLEQLWLLSPSAHHRNSIAWMDLQLQLPEEFLLMTDRFSMAHSLEARTPLLDREFVELALSIPAEIRITPERDKALFIAAVHDLLPQELLRARKRGFILPTGRWMQRKLRPLVEELCSRENLRLQGIFQEGVFESIVFPFLAGQGGTAEELWTLLSFQLWYQRRPR